MKIKLNMIALSTVIALGLSGCISAKQNTAAEADDDNDGVVNSMDECPDTAEGVKVDHRGCEILVELSSAHFDFDSAKLSSEAAESINASLEAISAAPVTVAGYTDATGPEAYNQQLSERRANTVANHLSEQGVDLNNITVVGHGEANPVASNDTKEGRAENRRVTITPTN